MVKVRFYKCNIFLSQDTPAYLELDPENQTVRLKVYEGSITYIDDTITGTNRGTYQVIQIWSINPNPLPATPIGRMLIVEVYDTSNNLLERHRLPYLYGTKYKSIQIRDENDNPLSCNISALVYPFYYCRYNSQYVDIPWSPDTEDRQFFEAYRVGDKKYYYIGKVTELAPLTNLALNPIEKAIVKIVYKINIPVLSALLSGVGQLPYVGNFLNSFFSFITNNFLWLERAIAKTIGINIPVINVEIDLSTNTLTAYYEQDIAPIIEFIIIIAVLAVFINLPRILDVIQDMTRVAEVSAKAQITESIAQQNQAVLSRAVEQCGGNQECIAQVLNALNVANTNITNALREIESLKSEVEKLKGQRLIIGLGAGLGGLAAGYLLSRPQIATRIIERVRGL